MSNFNRHVKSDRRKWVAVAVSIVLIVAVIVTGVLTDWFVHWNKFCLFGHAYNDEGVCTRCGAEKLDDVQEAPKDMAGGMVSDNGESAGISLLAMSIPREAYGDYGIMPIAESAKQLTATVSPATATDNKLDWSVAFADPSSAWATGKTVTDYVTVTPTADGALTANVQCLKAFGEQIVVTARSRQDTGIFGTSTVDYVKRVSSVSLNVTPSKASFDATYNVDAVPTYTDGTISGTFTITGYKVALSDAFATEFYKPLDIYVRTGGTTYWKYSVPVYKDGSPAVYYISDHYFKFDGSDAFNVFVDRGQYPSSSVSWTNGSWTDSKNVQVPEEGFVGSVDYATVVSLLNNRFVDLVKKINNDLVFTLSYTYVYQSVVSTSSSVEFNLDFDPSSLVVHVSSISLDKNLVF